MYTNKHNQFHQILYPDTYSPIKAMALNYAVCKKEEQREAEIKGIY